MTNTYTVHIYREMRLVFSNIEADSQEAAAEIARDKETAAADDITDCDGETLAALVDMDGDEEYEQSRVIDFEAERQRKVADELLEAVREAMKEIEYWHGGMLTELERSHPRGNGWARVYDKLKAARDLAKGRTA